MHRTTMHCKQHNHDKSLCKMHGWHVYAWQKHEYWNRMHKCMQPSQPAAACWGLT